MSLLDKWLEQSKRENDLLNSSSAFAYKVGFESSFWNSLVCFLCGCFALMVGVSVAKVLLLGG